MRANIYITLGRLGWTKKEIDNANLKEVIAILEQLRRQQRG